MEQPETQPVPSRGAPIKCDWIGLASPIGTPEADSRAKPGRGKIIMDVSFASPPSWPVDRQPTSMHDVSSSYSIEFCRPDDVPALKRFIHQHWRANHILCQDNALLNWQHGDPRRNRYTFVLAKRPDGKLAGVLGFIADDLLRVGPAPHNAAPRVIWFAIWKVASDVGTIGLGLKLRDFIVHEETPTLTCAIGLNPRTLPLYKSFGYRLGTMTQYYMLNSRVTSHRLVVHPPSCRTAAPAFSYRRLEAVAAGDLVTYGDMWRHDECLLPRKDRKRPVGDLIAG